MVHRLVRVDRGEPVVVREVESERGSYWRRMGSDFTAEWENTIKDTGKGAP